MAPDRQSMVEHAGAMFEQGPVEEGHDLVEEPDLSGDFKVVDDRVRQPQKIVGDTGSNAPAGRWVPPVLDVTVNELPCGGKALGMLLRTLDAEEFCPNRFFELRQGNSPRTDFV